MIGWTDDMRVDIDPDRTLDELVDVVLAGWKAGAPRATLLGRLTNEFALSYEDARLVLDRVGGGITRAATPSPQNEPSAERDPIAHRSYRRARGEPPSAATPRRTEAWRALLELLARGDVAAAREHVTLGLEHLASVAECQAANAWLRAIEARGTAGVLESADAAVRLAELTQATIACEVSAATRANVSMQLGTALDSCARVLCARIGPGRCAQAGSLEWIDAVRIGRTALQLATWFEEAADLQGAARAMEVRRRVVTGALGHCYERVGAAMLDAIRVELRVGERARAARMCEAVITDFTALVEDLETDAATPLDEQVVALKQLHDTLQLLAKLTETPSTHAALATRVIALLSRVSGSVAPTS